MSSRVSDTLSTAILGIIEGITEFLPISSTGHLLIAEQWLGERSELFNVAIQSGAILALVLIYRRRLLNLLTRCNEPAHRDYLAKLTVAFLTTAAGAYLATRLGWKLPESVVPVALATLIGGILILVIERYVAGKPATGGFARDVALDDENQDPADKGRQRHGYHGLRQLPSQAGGEISPRRRGQEGHGELRQVVAVRRLVAARQEIQQAAPVNEHQREDRARLDRHIEQLRAFTQPLLGDEQMPGARDGQKFGDAFDDAENGGAEGVGHLNLLTFDIELHAAHSEAEDCRELRAIRARSGRAGAKAPPDIEPHQRNHRIHEEARLRAEYAAGQPRGSLEARLEQAPLWHSRAVRRADDEQLHVVESDVKADRKPQRAGPQYRVAHHQAQ